MLCGYCVHGCVSSPREVTVATLTLREAARIRRTSLFGWYVVAVVTLGAILLATHLDQVRVAATTKPAFWMMAVLAVLAGTRAFVTSGSRGGPVVICPTLCFTFAILLCWDLGPAIVAQTAAIAVVSWRLRHTKTHAAMVAGQYALAFGAAYVVLVIGQPNPFGVNSLADELRDAASVAGAAAAWLVAYSVLWFVANRLRRSGTPWRHVLGALGYQTLCKAALLLLAPVLAVAAHVNAAFVPLIFVPLYAVDRMARLSAERDRASQVDLLTGLANRTGLQNRFADLVSSRGRAGGRSVALLMLDLDRFKQVNDTLGHEVGDQLLVAVARRLAGSVPRDVVVARLGGDEFAIVAPDIREATAACDLASQVGDSLAEPVRLDGLHIDIAASVGIAIYPDHGDDFATLMRHADIAMYEAKQRGDAVTVYRPDSDQHSPHRLGLLADLRHALQVREGGNITLHYQPQVAIDTGEVVGVEALLRWFHPTRGQVDTQELVHAAEHTAVMHLLTQRVIDDVVRQTARWAEAGLRLRASLNVSSRDLYCDQIVSTLSRRLAEHRVPPGQIQLEVTESALMADPNRVLSTMSRLSALGVDIALDDFGTGYSSLQHLRKLPLAEVKIDRSFVGAMARNGDDAVIVQSTVELARALGLRAVAEGVEDAETWKLLADTGCEVAQGWYTARPMPAEQIPSWLAEHAARPVPAMAG
jgi:diguanylate cyclase (GGDEF)-like protein